MGFSVEHGTPAVDALAPFIAAKSQAAVDAAFDYVTQAMGNAAAVREVLAHLLARLRLHSGHSGGGE